MPVVGLKLYHGRGGATPYHAPGWGSRRTMAGMGLTPYHARDGAHAVPCPANTHPLGDSVRHSPPLEGRGWLRIELRGGQRPTPNPSPYRGGESGGEPAHHGRRSKSPEGTTDYRQGQRPWGLREALPSLQGEGSGLTPYHPQPTPLPQPLPFRGPCITATHHHPKVPKGRRTLRIVSVVFLGLFAAPTMMRRGRVEQYRISLSPSPPGEGRGVGFPPGGGSGWGLPPPMKNPHESGRESKTIVKDSAAE
jgi:hypothetical protein